MHIIIFCFIILFQGTDLIHFTGRFSDVEADPETGDVSGTGTIVIKKENGIYHGLFSKIGGDYGESGEDVKLEHLKIDEKRKTISFQFKSYEFNSDLDKMEWTLKSVKGSFNKQGMSLIWDNRNAQFNWF